MTQVDGPILLDLALDGTRDNGENRVGVGANEFDCADYEYKDYSKHHSVFSDVLPFLICP